MQRLFDIFFSLLGILILLPLLIPISLLLYFTGEGEIFFIQDRIGKNGNIFKLIKFATMLKNSPSIGTGTVTIRNDPRILPFGGFLRKTKLNELPQLFNIFIGDMSLIGPRPLTRQTFSVYPSNVQSKIIGVRPGLSGIGSIIFRDEENIITHESNPLDFYSEIVAPYKGMLECWFVENYSIANYFKSIIVTAIVVFFPKSHIAWSFFKDLPSPPIDLRLALNYPVFLD
jgi:lipopolysaccharide/colanic/teichoic acid biosynthesis glycosyltransferase